MICEACISSLIAKGKACATCRIEEPGQAALVTAVYIALTQHRVWQKVKRRMLNDNPELKKV